MHWQHGQPTRSGASKKQEEEIFSQKLLAWRHYCKQFIVNALELIIQARGASFSNLNTHSPFKQFGMHIENMNDLEILLSSFDSLNPHTQCQSDGEEVEEETKNPIFQELILDIIHKTNVGQVLSERWTFNLALSPISQKRLAEHSVEGMSAEKNLANFPVYYKRLCVLLRTIRALSITLPSYNIVPRLLNSNLPSLKQSQQLTDAIKTMKTDYQMNFKREKIDFEFADDAKVKSKNLFMISNTFGEFSVELEYVSQSDIIKSIERLINDQQSRRQRGKGMIFQQALMNALGPGDNNQGIQLNQPQISQPQPQNPSLQNLKLINEQGRFRANSDNTFNQHISARPLKTNGNVIHNAYSPRPSEGFLIREDYFTTEKNKFYYQMSSKNSGQSYSSNQSNKSTDINKLLNQAFNPQINQLKTQGSSSLLKSSLEGGTFGNFDSHEFLSNRPTRPRIDPFKKFDNPQSSKNRNYRLSFDEGQKPLNSQRNMNSPYNKGFFANTSNHSGNNYRKGSVNIGGGGGDFSSLPVQHQLIVEEDQADFDNLLPRASSALEPDTRLHDNSPHTFLHNLPKLGSQIIKNEYDERPAVVHEQLRRLSSCSDMLMIKTPSQDFLFQIDEKKKYLGFLEESEEENSHSEEDDSTDDEESINQFLQKVENYQKAIEKTSANNSPAIKTDNNHFQSDMRRNFFYMLEVREVLIEHKNNQQKIVMQNRAHLRKLSMN